MNTPAENGLTDDHTRALQTLAHIALGSMSHTIERYAANDLLNYMGELERQRTEARDALAAKDDRITRLEDALRRLYNGTYYADAPGEHDHAVSVMPELANE